MSTINGGPMAPDPAAVNDRLRALGAEFVPFDRVRHVAQSEGKSGIVTGLQFREGIILYLVTWGPHATESGHFGPELEPAEDAPWAD